MHMNHGHKLRLEDSGVREAVEATVSPLSPVMLWTPVCPIQSSSVPWLPGCRFPWVTVIPWIIILEIISLPLFSSMSGMWLSTLDVG